ncbi:IFT27 [Lepeophtheirus salmonis]|uniref:IFT27 n=1 Tax=Lepeophtheirus salmonis TaxID=72036 RepID=A0A7R8CG54_LEPSM|nr:IFT27 [Lepeophtheirus salmonis]CAF2812764.1 IFT27 [Lepeophtheirus salmonis]
MDNNRRNRKTEGEMMIITIIDNLLKTGFVLVLIIIIIVKKIGLERGGGSRNTQMESQPRPGVHPEDWNEKSAEDPIDDRRDQRYNSDRINTPLWGQPSDHGYNPKKEGGRKRGNNRQNRNKNRDNKRIEDSISGPDGRLLNKGPDDRNSDPSWVDGGMNGRPYEDGNPFISADFGGDANLSLHRKYGYAVMAMSVVVLAVLMPAVAGIAQLDNYSLYSYKQGMVLPATTDTLRSGTIRSSMRTDTLRSSATNQQFRKHTFLEEWIFKVFQIQSVSNVPLLGIPWLESPHSSLTHLRWTGKSFPKNYLMTQGADMTHKSVNIPDTNDVVELYLLDSSGKEMYSSILSEIWKSEDIALVIVVYDVTNEESFLGVNRLHKSSSSEEDDKEEKRIKRI